MDRAMWPTLYLPTWFVLAGDTPPIHCPTTEQGNMANDRPSGHNSCVQCNWQVQVVLTRLGCFRIVSKTWCGMVVNYINGRASSGAPRAKKRYRQPTKTSRTFPVTPGELSAKSQTNLWA